MADTTIEWTDTVWNPTTGCDRVSPGCDHCYALSMAARLKAMGQPKYQADGDPRTSGPGFGVVWHEDVLDQPLHWRRPRRVFVNSMSDLFHPRVPDGIIAQVTAVMVLGRQHTFQVLTKRPNRMRSLLSDQAWRDLVLLHICALDDEWEHGAPPWPPPNVWLGVSVEDQERADQRIPMLLDTPAAVRFISAEPLLGPVDLTPWIIPWNRAVLHSRAYPDHVLGPYEDDLESIDCDSCDFDSRDGIGWVIVGGESGPGARPMHPDWARNLRDQCGLAGVPFFFKQWGGWAPDELYDTSGRFHVVMPEGTDRGVPWPGWKLDQPDAAVMRRVGKRAAGRELDGRTWDDQPPLAHTGAAL